MSSSATSLWDELSGQQEMPMAGKPILPAPARSCGWCRELESSRCHQCHGLAVLALRYHIPPSVHQEQRQSCRFEMASPSAVCRLLMRPQCINTSLIKS